MVKEECMWQQRSWVEWLKSGDLNTSYFHGWATQRNRRNFISKLILDDSLVVEETKQIGDTFVDYFKNIFTSSTSLNFDKILQEGLHSLIQQAELAGSIRGVSLCSAGPKVSHLFFVDDNLLFCRATTQECSTILVILHQYEESLGKKINQGKT